MKQECRKKFIELFGTQPNEEFIKEVASFVKTDSNYPDYNNDDVFLAIMNAIQLRLDSMEFVSVNNSEEVEETTEYINIRKMLQRINTTITNNNLCLGESFEELFFVAARKNLVTTLDDFESLFKKTISDIVNK